MLLPAVTYKSGLYGIPSQVKWSWTYYRTDIFNNLGIEAPETWDDLEAFLKNCKLVIWMPTMFTMG